MIERDHDFYKILQVHPDAAHEIIDAAYRCLSKKYHPDINKNSTATEYMKYINIAYGVIGDSRKRKQYHAEWVKKNKGDKTIASSNSNDMEQEKKKNFSKLKNEEVAAYGILEEFFAATINENWEMAYQKLTKLDMKNVSNSDFAEWKKAVTQIYKLGGYKITFFRRYQNCEYAGIIYPVILQFSVELKEMKVSNAQITEENTQKYVAFDGENWRVCLGYKDLKPNILKFKYLAQALPRADKEDVFIRAIEKIDLLTGLFSLNGFIEQAEREVLRAKRYGNPLSLGIIKIEPLENELFQEKSTTLDACVSNFAQVLCEGIRKTDLIGRCGDSFFAVAFTETKLPDAKKALDKLLDGLHKDAYLNYNVYSACVTLPTDTTDTMEMIINSTLEKVRLREKKKKSTNKNTEVKVKLGKYKVSDILGFNKNGRNHF